MPDAPNKNNPAPPDDRLPVRFLKGCNRLFCRAYHQITVRAPPRVPREGAAILVCNHISGLDPLLLQSVCPRLVTWMMAKEYYEIKALGWIFRTVEAIPVERSGRDLASTRQALRAFADGRVLGIFPEGKIEKTRELLPFQTGVALMAIKTGVPVYPAYLDGTQRNKPMVRAVLEANQVQIRFGPAVELDRSSTSKENLERATAAIRAAVASLQAKIR